MSTTGPETLKGAKNILIEGVECGGKTTLIDHIRHEIPGWDLKYLTHRDGDQFQRYAWEYMANSGTIFNRGHYSEVVYSGLHDRDEPFSAAQREALDSMVEDDCLVIFSDPRLEDAIERYKQRDVVQPIKLHELEVVHGMFKVLFENVPHVRYESTNIEARDSFVRSIPELLTQ